MQFPFRLPAGRVTRVLLACVLVLAAGVAFFDWNWLRAPLERHLSNKAAREVRFERLEVKIGFSLEPTITLRGVRIQNAPWAAARRFASAGEASFTVSLKSILQRRPVVSRLVLVDADVHMERLADGRRNWRLRHPEDRSPGKVRILALEAHRTQIRFTNHARELDLTIAATPVEERVEDGLSTRIRFTGTYAGTRFSGDAASGPVVSFRDSGVVFPLRGHIAWAKSRLTVDGFFADVFDPGPIDAAVRIEGATLAQLHPFIGIRPPPSRPFRFDAQLTHADRVYRFSRLRGTIGDSDVAGHATYDRSRERPRVDAELDSETARLADVSPLVGIRYPGSRARGGEKDSKGDGGGDAHDEAEAPRGQARVFPARALRTQRLRTIDARIAVHVTKLSAPGLSFLERVRTTAVLENGRLELKPLDIGLAGGRVAGSVVFDARPQTPIADAMLDLRGIRLERLVPSLSATARSAGAIAGEIRLAGEGRSIAALLGNASGSIFAKIHRGQISNLADAKLGLNGGKILSLLIRGDRDIALNCGAIAIDVRKGTGRSRVVLDTEQTHTLGAGTVDLRSERWDLLLTPEPRNPGLLTRRASVRAHGSFRTASAAIQERVELARGDDANGSSGHEGCPAAAVR